MFYSQLRQLTGLPAVAYDAAGIVAASTDRNDMPVDCIAEC